VMIPRLATSTVRMKITTNMLFLSLHCDISEWLDKSEWLNLSEWFDVSELIFDLSAFDKL
jgi:hypothetical protein